MSYKWEIKTWQDIDLICFPKFLRYILMVYNMYGKTT